LLWTLCYVFNVKVVYLYGKRGSGPFAQSSITFWVWPSFNSHALCSKWFVSLTIDITCYAFVEGGKARKKPSWKSLTFAKLIALAHRRYSDKAIALLSELKIRLIFARFPFCLLSKIEYINSFLLLVIFIISFLHNIIE